MHSPVTQYRMNFAGVFRCTPDWTWGGILLDYDLWFVFEGIGILKTEHKEYDLSAGTSMACPLVAGCFGLLKSYHPDWTNEQLITQVLGTADNINSINKDILFVSSIGHSVIRVDDEDTEESKSERQNIFIKIYEFIDENRN